MSNPGGDERWPEQPKLVTPKRQAALLSSGGFTYLAVLMLVMIMGIMLGAMGECWKMVMKREREEELLFRGNQIRQAIERWNKPMPGQHMALPLRDLKDLLKSPHSLSKVRYLRRLYKDPLTNSDWVLISDPVRGIIGVASSSEDAPVKQANFPEECKNFEGKAKYSEWQFIYDPAQQHIVNAKMGKSRL